MRERKTIEDEAKNAPGETILHLILETNLDLRDQLGLLVKPFPQPQPQNSVPTKQVAIGPPPLPKQAPNSLKWEPAEGPKGPYEKTDDTSNPEYKRLLSEIQKHSGFHIEDGYRFWKFSTGNPDVICRRLIK